MAKYKKMEKTSYEKEGNPFITLKLRCYLASDSTYEGFRRGTLQFSVADDVIRLTDGEKDIASFGGQFYGGYFFHEKDRRWVIPAGEFWNTFIKAVAKYKRPDKMPKCFDLTDEEKKKEKA